VSGAQWGKLALFDQPYPATDSRFTHKSGAEHVNNLLNNRLTDRCEKDKTGAFRVKKMQN
jgi:hypothetical protein